MDQSRKNTTAVPTPRQERVLGWHDRDNHRNPIGCEAFDALSGGILELRDPVRV